MHLIMTYSSGLLWSNLWWLSDEVNHLSKYPKRTAISLKCQIHLEADCGRKAGDDLAEPYSEEVRLWMDQQNVGL